MITKTIKRMSLFCVFFLTVLAHAGNEGGHGGDPLTVEFIARGRYILGKLRLSGPRILDPLTTKDVDALEKAVSETRVELVEEKLIDPDQGVVTSLVLEDPKSPGKKLIRMNRDFWKDILTRNFSINRYVFHEYLRVIGKSKEDDNYQISSRLDSDDRLKLLPSESVTFGELLEGKFYPITPGGPLTQSDVEASDSYYENYTQWSAELERSIRNQLGPEVVPLDINLNAATPKEDCAGDGTTLLKSCANTPENWVIGKRFQAHHKLTLLLDVKNRSKQIFEFPVHPKIEGNIFYFKAVPKSSSEEVVRGINQAKESYALACAKWRETVKAKYANNFVFAVCNESEEIRAKAEQFSYGRSVKFVSAGSIFVLADK